MQKDKKLELLAPAGSKEAFLSAIEAGADSVYTGIKEYNARLKADNLNLYDFAVLCDYAKSRNVKVYLAFNTLIKHTEIHNTVKILSKINEIKPDGIIVQDMGLAEIIKMRFPELALHASTQMAVHNSHGVKVLSDFGFKRVILARELSFSEIKLINNKTNTELEIFCHGALCFCISGMCLFSSFIGGHSGNRGLCTQPCRRIWKNSDKEGYLFSPKDFMLSEYVGKLKKSGIKALKIEGRMRSSEYVYRVVKAYRMLIDSSGMPDDNVNKEAYELLNRDYARNKTTYLFSGKDPNIIVPNSAQCMGKEIGSIRGYSEGYIFIRTKYQLSEGDRIRISDPKLDMTRNIKISGLELREGIYKIPYSGEVIKKENPVFLAGESSWDEKVFTKELDRVYDVYAKRMIKSTGKKISNDNVYTGLISSQWNSTGSDKSESLWVRFCDPRWHKILSEAGNNVRPVMVLNRDNVCGFRGDKGIEPSAIELPPFIAQRDIGDYSKVISEYYSLGVKRWVLNNISQFEYFKNFNAEIITGHFLYAWNLYSARAYKDMGAKYFTASWEDDFLNIRRLSLSGIKNNIIVYLYGYPNLVNSKMIEKEMFNSRMVSDKNNLRLSLHFTPTEGLICPEQPFSIFTAKSKLKDLGISNFGIDLNFLKPDIKIWEKIYGNYKKGINSQGSLKFNFKKGVK